jgi:hypothetical protein
VSQTNDLDVVEHNHYDLHDRTLDDNVGDGDAQYDKSRLDNDSGANSSDPNIKMDQCSDMDATMLDNIPNNMANASTPTTIPKTNHKLVGDKYILVQ